MLREKEEKLPFGARKSKGSFGKKPSNGSFGKKPSNGSFGKKPAGGTFGEKPTSSLKQTPLKAKKTSNGLRQTRLKPKSSKSKATALEREYLEWLHSEGQYMNYPCFVCGKINPNDRIAWHHVKEHSSDKKDHRRVIPLCDHEHHRNGTEMSPHGTPKKWREKYSVEVQNEFAKKIWHDFLDYKGVKYDD